MGYDHGLHASCRFILHPLGDMPVLIKRKSRRMVPEILLHGLYIDAGLNGQHRVGVPEIVKATVRQVDCGYDPFECVVDRGVRIMAAEGIREYQIHVVLGSVQFFL